MYRKIIYTFIYSLDYYDSYLKIYVRFENNKYIISRNTLLELINNVKNKIKDDMNPVYDALIIFDYVFKYVVNVLKSKN
jgi:hypothetical protein